MTDNSFATEHKLPLSAIIKAIPDLATISPRSLLRWAHKGTKGVRLESVRVGGRTLSSIEAVKRFLAALNSPSTTSTSNPTTPGPRSPHARSKASARAAAELEAAGC